MPIELIPRRPNSDNPFPSLNRVMTGQRRATIFACIFALGCLAGLTYTFIRPPIYQSTATLLILPPVTADPENNSTNIQHAAIQRQVLISHSLLNKLLQQPSKTDALQESVLDRESLQLEVIPIADTNMLELQAEGPQRDVLPALVNSWIDLYLENHAASQATSSNSASTALQQQLQELDRKVVEKRLELERFRNRYDIVSMERTENEVLTRLQGLTQALNKARDEEAVAEAQLIGINEALAQGKPVIRAQDQAGLASLEQRAVQLREQLKEFEEQFTPRYMALDPKIVALTRNLESIGEQIQLKLREGQRTAVAEAEQTLSSARYTVSNLQQQLATYKQTVQDFTTRFAEHEALREELAQLEELDRQVKERLVQMEVNEQEQFPQVQVLERASFPTESVRPAYLRDAGISVMGSLLLALLAVWGYEFLTRSPRQSAASGLQSLFYPVPSPQNLPRTTVNELPLDQPVAALEHHPIRELSRSELAALLAAADHTTRLLIGFLLSGLSLEEATALRWQHIDLRTQRIDLSDQTNRTLSLPAPLQELIAKLAPEPVGSNAPVWQDQEGRTLTVQDLSALISCAAHDAGLSNPSEITPQVLRHTYLVFLVRQGVRLADLKSIVGHQPPAALAAYTTFSPPGPGLPLDQIEHIHPALNHISAMG